MEIVDKIIKYENGEMNEEEIIIFFQELINRGLICQLQGHYHRTANDLIKGGYCLS